MEIKQIEQWEGNKLLAKVYETSLSENSKEQFLKLIEELIEGNIPEKYINILKEYGIDLSNKSEQEIKEFLKGDSICQLGKISPLGVAFQIFYSSLHEDFKGKDLDLSFLNKLKDSSKEEIIEGLFKEIFQKSGIGDFNNHKMSIQYAIQTVINKRSGIDLLKIIPVQKIFEKYYEELIKIFKMDNGKKALIAIRNNCNLETIIGNPASFTTFTNLLEEDGINKIEQFGNHNDFISYLINGKFPEIEEIKLDEFNL